MISQILTVQNVVLLLLFVIYELFYKIFVINKIEWRVKRSILTEQTDIVEGIKSYYNENLEKIKALNSNENDKLKHALDKLLTLQLQHRTEERQALVNFSENCNRWVFNLSRIKFEHYGLENINELKAKIDNIRDEHFLNIYVEKAKIILFIANENVNAATNSLFDLIEDCKRDMESGLIDLLSLLKQQYSSRYETEIIDDFGEGIMTCYAIDNSARIADLTLEFEDIYDANFRACMAEIEHFASSAKLYLMSSEFNKQ